MNSLVPCPFCGGQPELTGFEYTDENRYCEMSLECCSTMTEKMGYGEWRRYEEPQREALVKERLFDMWNKRYIEENE